MSVIYPGTTELPPPYDPPPPWIPVEERIHSRNYNNNLQMFLPRTVILKRLKAADTLGFNIRGGKEHNFPFFVSKVMPESEASRLGILEGDQIVKVNGIDFDTLDHAEAVRVLKFNTTIEMIVRYFPFGKGNYRNGMLRFITTRGGGAPGPGLKLPF